MDMRTQLQEQEELFWELNVPDVKERTRLKIIEGLVYKQQAEGPALDFFDFLADHKCFPWIRSLGQAPTQTVELGSQKGTGAGEIGKSHHRDPRSEEGVISRRINPRPTPDGPPRPNQGQETSGEWSE